MTRSCHNTTVLFPPAEDMLQKKAEICPVYWAMEVAELAMKQSCGRGAFCRDGLKQLYLLIRDITEGKGTAEVVELLQELVETMSLMPECQLCDGAVALIALSLRQHERDWMAHVLRRRCAANRCPGYEKTIAAAQGGEGRRRRATAPSSAAAPVIAIPDLPIAEEPSETPAPTIRPAASKLVLQTDGKRRRVAKGGIIAIIED